MNTETITVVPVNVVDNAESAKVKRINEDGSVDTSNLTSSELTKYNKINSVLKINDINSIANYGSDLQNAMSKYSGEFLSTVRNQQSGEIGGLIDNLLGQLDYIDVDDLKAPSKFVRFMRKMPIVKHMVKSVEKVLQKYDTIENNIDTISKKIQATRLTSIRDNNALQIMFNNNVEYCNQIEQLIIAGKIKLEEINSTINEMLQNPNDYEAYQISDAQNYQHSLERRLNDLNTLRYIMRQSLTQIRTVQNNNIAIAERAQTIVNTTVPVWKNQLSIAVALYNQKDSIDAHRKISETTNEILKKNAELLHTNSVEVAKENERSVVELETLKTTTAKLIETIREVKEIHANSTAQRRLAEQEMQKLETELDNKMISIGSISDIKQLN